MFDPQDDRLPGQPRQGGTAPAAGSGEQQMSQTVQQTGGQRSILCTLQKYFTLLNSKHSSHHFIITPLCPASINQISVSQEFSRLCPSDRSVLLGSNLSLVAVLTTASMFPLHMQWTMQLSPLLGELEVEDKSTGSIN